jgi:ATP/maltotriose-dependent transcriptional regulator MalT
LRGAGLELGADEVAELHQRTEGWPTGLYLAALYLLEGGSLLGAAISFGGDDRLVSQYIAAARQHLVNAQRVRPTLTRAIPHLAVQARIELARAHLGLAAAT